MTWATTESGSLNLIARAGTGKTSTLVHLLPYLTGSVFFGAFNKAIVEDISVKVGRQFNVAVGTWHSLGLRLFRKIKPQLRIESRKVRTIAKKYYPTNMPIDKTCLKVVCEAVSYAKQSGFGLKGIDYTLPEKWTEIIDHYDLWDEVPGVVKKEDVIKVCIDVYDISLEQCMDGKDAIIDFDDMILAPLIFGETKPDIYDWVLIDEAQDTNEVRRRLALWVLKADGRVVAVGDPKQSIYGFAGATNNAMDLISSTLKSSELPLSVTYRCPKSVVELAQTWVPDIQAHESAPAGSVTSMSHRTFLRTDFRSTDAILCRNTRPLIGIAKALRKRGVSCVVEGVNYQGLISLCSKWGEEIPISRMLIELREYTGEEVAKWLVKENEEKAEQVREKYEMVCDFAEGVDRGAPVYRLLDHIEALLSHVEDDREVLRLCTVHRSKGREWDRVFLVGRNQYMPSKYAKKEWELKQEENLMYVAVTRAKKELVEVGVPVKKSGQGQVPWWEEMG